MIERRTASIQQEPSRLRGRGVGELERIEMDSSIPNDGQPWTVTNDDMPTSEEVKQELARRLRTVIGSCSGDETDASTRNRRNSAQTLRAIIGKWPGDETDEQIEAALKEFG